MKTATRIAILAITVVLIGSVAYARFAKPQDAIQYRKAVMVLIGQHFKRMGAVIKGQAAYDPAAFTADALDVLAKRVVDFGEYRRCLGEVEQIRREPVAF